MADKSDVQSEKVSISFGFSKKKEHKKIKSSKTSDLEYKEDVGTDFITSFEEGKHVESNKQTGELVIPLIQTNKWRKPKRPGELDADDKNEDGPKKKQKKLSLITLDGDQTESAAVQEILNEAASEQEKWEERDKIERNVVVPLLVKNKVPDGFETDDKLDVSLRPEEASVADYDAVPIEQYGLAMLRGMGWKEGIGIGKKSKVFKPIEAAPRPKGLGLGADRSMAQQLDGKSKGKVSSGDRDGQEAMVIKNGAYCIVTSGKHNDNYGMIEGIDEENARVVVKLALSGKSITLSQYAIQLVTKKEYDKYSKYLNKSKVDKYKAEEEQKHQSRSDRNDDKQNRHRDKHRDRHRDSDRENDHHSSKDSYRDEHKHRRDNDREEKDSYRNRSNRKHEEHRHGSKDREKRGREEDSHSHDQSKHAKRYTPGSSNGHGPPFALWVRQHLRVRVIDPEYKKGKYFKTKVIVEDVVSEDNCICRTEEGKVLEDLSQSMLETVIPRSIPSYIMIVSGKSRGQLGEVLQKDKSACQATVQLLSDRNKALKLDFDSICEYTGDINMEFDY